jgi:Mrp family chromosome partitioning ATPase
MHRERGVYGESGTDAFSSPYRAVESALGAYLRAIKAHWLVFALVVLVSLGAAVAALNLAPQKYEAHARVLVSPVPPDDPTFVGVQVIRDAGDPTRTAQTAATLLESERAAEVTAARLKRSWTPSRVAAAVSVEPLGESNVLAVRATAETPDQASTVATEYARSAVRVRAQAVAAQIRRLIASLQARQDATGRASDTAAAELAGRVVQLETSLADGDPTLSFEQAAGPAAAIGPSSSLVLVLALLAGMALAAAAAVLLELTRTRVRDSDEARALFPIPVLARVPRLSRRTLRVAANGSFRLQGAAQQAFRTVYLQLIQGEADRRVIMLTGASRGDGTTTCAVFLAVSIAFTGKQVILMDCDLRSPAADRLLGVDAGPPVTVSEDTDANLERKLIPVPGLPLSVMSVGAATHSAGGLEFLVNQLSDLLESARRSADVVVVDTAPLGEVSDALPLLRDADDVIVITRPGHTDRRAFEVMRDLIQRMTTSVRGMIVVGVTPDVPSRTLGHSPAAGQPSTVREKLNAVLER